MRRRQRFTVFLNLLGETPLLARLQLYLPLCLPLQQKFVGRPLFSKHILHATAALGHGRNALLLLQSGAVEEMRCRTRRTDLAGRRNRRAKRDSTNTPLTPFYSVADELPQMPFLNTKYFLKKFMKCYNFLLFGNCIVHYGKKSNLP